MEVWDSSRIPKMVVRQVSPTVKPVEARLTLSCRCIYVIFFGPKGHFIMNKYLCYWTWNLVIILLLYVWFEYPGHTYGGFVPSFSERGMTEMTLLPLVVVCALVLLPGCSLQSLRLQQHNDVEPKNRYMSSNYIIHCYWALMTPQFSSELGGHCISKISQVDESIKRLSPTSNISRVLS
jgi:hypothetical protein